MPPQVADIGAAAEAGRALATKPNGTNRKAIAMAETRNRLARPVPSRRLVPATLVEPDLTASANMVISVRWCS